MANPDSLLNPLAGDSMNSVCVRTQENGVKWCRRRLVPHPANGVQTPQEMPAVPVCKTLPPERSLAAKRLHSTNQALGWIPALRKRLYFPGWSLYFKKFFPSFVVGSDGVYLGFLRHSWSGICPRLALNSCSSCFCLTCARVTGMCHLKPAFLKANYIMIIKFGHKCFLGHNVFASMCGCGVCVCLCLCVCKLTIDLVKPQILFGEFRCSLKFFHFFLLLRIDSLSWGSEKFSPNMVESKWLLLLCVLWSEVFCLHRTPVLKP